MGKNDIFNTNLLQLPMKAQVADEGVVQDIAPVAAPADLAGGVAELELDALNQRRCSSAVERCDAQKS